jgi:hypothetical protein
MFEKYFKEVVTDAAVVVVGALVVVAGELGREAVEPELLRLHGVRLFQGKSVGNCLCFLKRDVIVFVFSFTVFFKQDALQLFDPPRFVSSS